LGVFLGFSDQLRPHLSPLPVNLGVAIGHSQYLTAPGRGGYYASHPFEVQGVVIALCEEEQRMAEPQDTVLTIDQLADYLKLSKSSLYHLARRGDVPGQKIGRHWRFHKAAIDKWLGQRRKQKG
jgi:excisionase family DNA binding protein